MSKIHKYEPLWGRWKVDRQIGEGSYGKVYEVSRNEFGIEYTSAVKIISIPQNKSDINVLIAEGMDEDSIRSFYQWIAQDILQEIDLMQKMKGTSNIVCIEDHCVIELEDEIGFDILIRMELLESLTSIMMSRRLSTDEVAKMAIDLCKALELCASYKLIHRDIKPDNIFVSSHGNFKLGDFGIARQIERTTAELSRKGSYTYMAPEIYNGQAYNASVDLYSLGIVMYRLLNQNRAPFMPESPNIITPEDKEQSIARRMSGEKIPPLGNVEAKLSDIVLKACSFDRNMRYANPSEMKEATVRLLRASTNDESIEMDVLEAEMPLKALGTEMPADTNMPLTVNELHFEPTSSSFEIDTVRMPGEIIENMGLTEQSQVKPRYSRRTITITAATLMAVIMVILIRNIVQCGVDYPEYVLTQSIPPARTPIPDIPHRFPVPSSWPGNVLITLELHGTRSSNMFDQPSAVFGVLVETIWNDARLEYLNTYERDANNDAVYWLRVRSALTGNEGYISSTMLQANIYDDYDNLVKTVAFERHGSSWIKLYSNDGHVTHVGYDSEGFFAWILTDNE